MKAKSSLLLAALAIGLTVSGATAQVTGNPPSITIIRWVVDQLVDELPGGLRLYSRVVVYDRDLGIGTPASISNFDHHEGDFVTIRVDVTDPDWIQPITQDPMTGELQNGNEEVFLRIRAFGLAGFAPPSPPPIGVRPEGYFPEEEGFRPIPGPTIPYHYFHTFDSFEIPEFIGRNQRRLRGEIDFDVAYRIELCATNNKEELALQACTSQTVLVIENPILRPANPQAIADAGPDQTVVVNTLTVLDASRTFDAFNEGFNVHDPNVFEKDLITFAWEMISGPAPVTLAQDNQFDPTAEVTFAVPGVYVFRVIANDNVSPAGPTSDSVTITVVESLPDQTPPVALAAHPANAVQVGAIITLDASQSYDPDGAEQTAALTYRWKQTTALGDPLPPADLLKAFQPLSGVDAKVSTWQAVTPGTFYFRLLVSDGIFTVATDLFSVTVATNVTNGLTETTVTGSPGATASTQSDNAAPAVGIPGLCGAGLAPLAFAPLALALMRRRSRST